VNSIKKYKTQRYLEREKNLIAWLWLYLPVNGKKGRSLVGILKIWWESQQREKRKLGVRGKREIGCLVRGFHSKCSVG